MAIQTLQEAMQQGEVLFGCDGRTSIVAACVQAAATMAAPNRNRDIGPDTVAEDAYRTFVAVVSRFST